MLRYGLAVLGAVIRISIVIVASLWALERAGDVPQALARDARLPAVLAPQGLTPLVAPRTPAAPAAHLPSLSPAREVFGSARHHLPTHSRFAR